MHTITDFQYFVQIKKFKKLLSLHLVNQLQD